MLVFMTVFAQHSEAIIQGQLRTMKAVVINRYSMVVICAIDSISCTVK